MSGNARHESCESRGVNQDTIPTLRMRAVTQRVVVVHDDTSVTWPLAEALSAHFLVRLATDGASLREQLVPLARVTCVVGVLDAAVRARDVHDLFVAAGGSPERLVFVEKSELDGSALAVERTLDLVRTVADRRL